MASRGITLYTHPGTCAVVPHILLNYAGVEFQLQPVKGQSVTSDFAATNPKKQVPVFVMDGEIITEAPAIAQAINQVVPKAKIFGRSPMQFVRVCEWLNYMSAAIHAQAW